MPAHVVHVNKIDIWYETFGDIKNPAILLMMGNSCDAVIWPDQFCKNLAHNGHYVIRFDQRDTGLSTWFDFNQAPYTLFNMMEDALGLLNILVINKAHIVGFSTGGTIAQLLALHHSDKVLSLTLMMTSMDLTIKNDAFAGKDMSNAPFAPPTKEFIDAVSAINAQPTKNNHEKIVQLVQNFNVANGKIAPFDTDFYYKLFEKSMKRIEQKTNKKSHIGHASNHALATSATKPVTQQELASITTPTLIIAGGQDPIFPPGHAEAMAKIIPNAQLLIISQMGHILTPLFFEEIITTITKHTQ